MSPGTKIFVGNLPYQCRSDSLRERFARYGKVEECDVIKKYGFVHMADRTHAKEAIEALNGIDFMGSKITVEESQTKVRPKPGMGGRAQCFNCGRAGHWSKECYDRRDGGYRSSRSFRGRGAGPSRFGSSDQFDRSRRPHESSYRSNSGSYRRGSRDYSSSRRSPSRRDSHRSYRDRSHSR